jgi:cytochrome P450
LQYLPDPPKFRKARSTLFKFAYALIAARRRDPDVSTKPDVLSLYIHSTEESDEFLKDVIMNFLIAGRDTTGQTLQWLFYELSQNPHVEAKLLDEISSILGGKSSFTYSDLKELKYLHDVIKETLRLYPPVPYNGKSPVDEDVLPNGLRVHPGQFIWFSPWIMGRDAARWGADCLSFRPERWSELSNYQIHAFAYIPFNAGPRVCLGKRMAEIEIQVLVCLLLPKFHMKHVESHIVQPVWNFTIKSRYNMLMQIVPRDK